MVLLGHLWYKSNVPIVNQAIYSFHMPLFFLISGLVIKTENKENVKVFIKKQTVRLFLPAFIFVIMSLPAYVVIVDEIIFGEVIKKICFWEGLVPYNDPCWFFFVLYEAKIIERLLNVSARTFKAKAMICIASLLIGNIVYLRDIFLPFGLDRCLVAFGFLVSGLCIKDIYYQRPSIWIRWKELVFAIVLILWILSGICFNTKVSMYGFEVGKYWMFILSGICGSLMFMILCRKVDKQFLVFRQWGQNTIFIVCTHYFFVSLFSKFTDIIEIQYTWMYNIAAIILAAALICCYMPVCDFVNKYIPILNGRSGRKCTLDRLGGNN